MKPIVLRLTDEMAAELDAYCTTRNVVRTKFIINAISESLSAAEGTPITRVPLGVKAPLPLIDMTNRETIQFHADQQTFEHGEYNITLGCWLPAVWNEYFHDLARTSNRAVSGVAMARIKQYMDDDDILRYAEDKGWPTAYARRYLINHVFPELPFCDFGPPPARRAFARRKRGG